MHDGTMPSLPQDGPVYVVGYVRVSGKRQQTEGASLETQEQKIRERCKKNGWILLDIVEEVFSGYYLRERKKLAGLREEYVRGKKAHVVMVNSLDRLSREQLHQAVLVNEMIEHGVRLESVTERLDDGPLGQFLRQALAFASAIERERIIERSSRSVQKRVEDGHMIGSGRDAAFGWLWGDERKTHYVIDPENSEIRLRIYRMYVHEGYTQRGIARQLNDEGVPSPRETLWTAAAVGDILADPQSKGVGYNRKYKVEWVDGKRKKSPHPDRKPLPDGIIPAIVSEKLWNAAQAKREAGRQEAARRNKHPKLSLLRSGYAKCGYCGRVLSVDNRYVKRGKDEHLWHEVTYRCPRGATQGKRDHNLSIGARTFDAEAWQFVGDFLNVVGDIRSVLQARVAAAQANVIS